MTNGFQELTLREKRLTVLQRVAAGELDPDEGALLLKAYDRLQPASIDEVPEAERQSLEDDAPRLVGTVIEPEVLPGDNPSPEVARDIARWKRWYVLPLGVGVFFAVLGALLMYWGYTAAGMSWGFWLSWLPLGLGLLLMILAWWSQTARWLHVRINQKPGDSPRTIAISMPLPLHLTGWFFRVFGHFIPDIKGQPIGEMIIALEQSLSPDSPFFVKVDDEDGETVEVYIG